LLLLLLLYILLLLLVLSCRLRALSIALVPLRLAGSSRLAGRVLRRALLVTTLPWLLSRLLRSAAFMALRLRLAAGSGFLLARRCLCRGQSYTGHQRNRAE